MLGHRPISIIIVVSLLLFIVPPLLAQELIWKQKADLPKPLRGTAIACNEMVYFMEANPKSSSVYELDPISNIWKRKTKMITWGWNVNLAQVNGMVYAIGGDPFRDRNECYDPKSNSWKTLSPMLTARQHTNCCVVSGKIYVIGGLERGMLRDGDPREDWAKKARLSSQNEVYDPKTNTWEAKAPLPTPRQGPGIGNVNGKIYAIGGAISSAYDSPPSKIVEVYDIEKNTWERRSDFPIAITTMGIVANDETLYVIGGQTRNNKGEDIPISNVYNYDSENDKWVRTTDLPNPIQVVSATIFDGCIYVIGGCDHQFKPMKQVWYAETR